MSTENRLVKSSDRINRIKGLVPLYGRSLSGSALEVIRFACGSPNKFPRLAIHGTNLFFFINVTGWYNSVNVLETSSLLPHAMSLQLVGPPYAFSGQSDYKNSGKSRSLERATKPKWKRWKLQTWVYLSLFMRGNEMCNVSHVPLAPA